MSLSMNKRFNVIKFWPFNCLNFTFYSIIMRRPPSYSDSFLIKTYSLNHVPPLEPLWLEPLGSEPLSSEALSHTDEREPRAIEPNPLYVLFIIKCSLHILFISSFESIFYFLYVSESENTGILKVINVYYEPIVNDISNWTTTSKTILLDILNYEINKTAIDIAGSASAYQRRIYNTSLLNASIGYSMFCLCIFGFMCGIVYFKNIKIKWQKLFIEQLSFICLLALYEYFFYITIIYKYTTISTDELNQYIVDGLYKALNSNV